MTRYDINERFDCGHGWGTSVSIFWNGDAGQGYVDIALFRLSNQENPSVEKSEGFSNLKSLSAYIESELGLLVCAQILHKNHVPKDSDLWTLNHTGWIDMSREPALLSL